MYNSYHSLMTTLKSLFLLFCCNKFIINPDFVVRLQVTILKHSQIANDSDRYSSRSVGSAIVSDSDYRSMFCAPFAWSSGFVLCAVIFLSQCHCHSVTVQALF